MVEKERFDSVDYIANIIKKDNIQGDIVETGVWGGGMCIYLSKHFPDRLVWACDSYKGCQDLSTAKYKFTGSDPHIYGMYSYPLSWVIQNFKALNCSNVIFLPGWFKDTLDKATCPINKIALLRFDGDSYSATKEVLEGLYDKVVHNGFVIIDDYCLEPSRVGLLEFIKERGLKINLLSPLDNKPVGDKAPCGVWWRKQ